MVKVGHKLTLKGKNNSVETTWLAITETRHDFLVQEDLLQTSLYGRQEWDSILVPQKNFIRSALLHKSCQSQN